MSYYQSRRNTDYYVEGLRGGKASQTHTTVDVIIKYLDALVQWSYEPHVHGNLVGKEMAQMLSRLVQFREPLQAFGKSEGRDADIEREPTLVSLTKILTKAMAVKAAYEKMSTFERWRYKDRVVMRLQDLNQDVDYLMLDNTLNVSGNVFDSKEGRELAEKRRSVRSHRGCFLFSCYNAASSCGVTHRQPQIPELEDNDVFYDSDEGSAH